MTDRNIFLTLAKKDDKWWDRLNSGIKLSFIKTDFSRWRDEDDDDEPSANAGFDMSQFANMGGMGGMNGMPDMSAMGDMPGMDDMDFSKFSGAPNMQEGDENDAVEDKDTVEENEESGLLN